MWRAMLGPDGGQPSSAAKFLEIHGDDLVVSWSIILLLVVGTYLIFHSRIVSHQSSKDSTRSESRIPLGLPAAPAG